jgi:hypothetical protein
MIVFDSDDFGCNHVISDMCQSHDCRDMLMLFKEANPSFKATLFTIPGEMTPELLAWSLTNKSWIELAVHGFWHTSNYECEKLTYEQFDSEMNGFIADSGFLRFFVKGFKAPGWQIGDGCYQWLLENGYWVADKSYNDSRRPKGLRAYVNREGNDFFVTQGSGNVEIDEEGSHHHTWDCVGNGVYEQKDIILERIKGQNFKFISEVLDENL